jgi:Ca2+-binding RTX toxin-like protein
MLTSASNLSGNSLDNLLFAGTGDNVLDGGAKIDTASYLYADSAVTVSLAVTVAQATGGSGSDTLVNIENLTGGDYNDTLIGNSGANGLNGGIGADTLIGGDGSDRYFVDNINDVVTETNANTSTGGTDTVNTFLSAYTLGANVENGLVMSTGIANLTGNSLRNLLYAGSGDNILNGGTGTDTVSYTYASSAVTVNLAITSAQTTGSSGSDKLISIENLVGSDYNDTLIGNSKANVLKGEGGADTLTGGNGKDVFDFNALSDMGTLNGTWDVITDFTQGQDRIDLSSLDANTATIHNDAFTGFIANDTSFTAAGQLMMSNGVLYGNTNADSAAEFAIQLTGITTLSISDMVL